MFLLAISSRLGHSTHGIEPKPTYEKIILSDRRIHFARTSSGLRPIWPARRRCPARPALRRRNGPAFGTHQAFSAALEFQTTDASSNTIIMPGKLSLAGGKSRFEMNVSEMQNTNI